MNLSWREPLWLLILFYPLLLIGWHYRQQRKQAQNYADIALLPWVQAGTQQWQHYIRSIIWTGFWCLIAIALAGPRLPLDANNAPIKPNKTIMVVVDVSRSMHTADISPNRLQRAELELYELSQMARASRIGIIVYAARPHLLVPTTSDLEAIKFYIEKLDTLVLPTLGSDPIAALQYAGKQLRNNTDSANESLTSLPQSILWLTDGDIATEQQTALKKTTQQLKQAGIPLYILGIGTEDGEAIPIGNDNEQAPKKWLHYNGKIVRSRLNSTLLQQLIEESKGRYSSVKDDESDWQILYKQGIEKREYAISDDEKEQQWQELYRWALFPALLLVFTLVTLPRHLFAIIILLGLPMIQPAKADSTLEAGIHAYRSENYSQAIKHFSAAVFSAEKDTERARALHNLGNSYFQQGNYNAAIQVFRDALTYRPNHQPTTSNLHLGEIVQTELERQLAAKQQRQQSNNSGGNRFEKLHNVLDGNQDSANTWGESKSTVKNFDLPALPLNTELIQKLVNNGLKRLAQNNISDMDTWKKSQQSQQEARIALQQMNDDPTVFWKRLFEMEEGFPASLDIPKELSGILPW